MMFMWSAKRAASRNVFCSPLPPSMTGMLSRNRGLFMAPRAVYQVPSSVAVSPRSIGEMIVSASSSRSKRCPKVPNSKP